MSSAFSPSRLDEATSTIFRMNPKSLRICGHHAFAVFHMRFLNSSLDQVDQRDGLDGLGETIRPIQSRTPTSIPRGDFVRALLARHLRGSVKRSCEMLHDAAKTIILLMLTSERAIHLSSVWQ